MTAGTVPSKLRFPVRIAPRSEKRAVLLSTVKSLGLSIGVRARNLRWTSNGALEIDLFAPCRGDIELCLAAFEPLERIEFVKDLQAAPPFRSTEYVVREARELFSAERYWESHEVLEGVWRTMTGEEKRYVQGVILVCAALVHHQKGEDEVALSVLRRATKQMSLSRRYYHGIDVDGLKGSVARLLDSLDFVPFAI
jgi:hypothetical protein